MSQSIHIAAQSARFSEAVRAFAPVCASRYAKLLPFKEGIVELRQEGASYRLIRELLATADVAVAVDTIGNFVREVIEQRPPSRPNPCRRSVRTVNGPPPAYCGQAAVSVHRGTAGRASHPSTDVGWSPIPFIAPPLSPVWLLAQTPSRVPTLRAHARG